VLNRKVKASNPQLLIAQPLATIVTRPEICIQKIKCICIKTMDM
jgi:hypothetical protein